MTEQCLGQEHPDPSRPPHVRLLIIYWPETQELAEIYLYLSKYDASEQFNARALSLKENSLASSNSDIGEGLSHLARLNFSQGKYVKALDLAKRALDLIEQELGPYHALTARCKQCTWE